ELITNVSHDLKTPLTSIISYVDLLSKEEGLPEHVNDYIKILKEKSDRLKTLISDLFDLTKATSGEINVNFEKIDLGKLVRQTLADLNDEIVKSGLTFKINIPEHPIFIKSDGKKLYRVFLNLISNTLKYSLAGSRVYIDLVVGNCNRNFSKYKNYVSSINNAANIDVDIDSDNIENSNTQNSNTQNSNIGNSNSNIDNGNGNIIDSGYSNVNGDANSCIDFSVDVNSSPVDVNNSSVDVSSLPVDINSPVVGDGNADSEGIKVSYDSKSTAAHKDKAVYENGGKGGKGGKGGIDGIDGAVDADDTDDIDALTQVTAIIKNIASYEMSFTEDEILERFARGDKARSSEGSGLGLAIAQSFTQVCGGKFDIIIDGDMFKVILKFNLVREKI
ncbi:MAG: sensor histidine kinase, partial [Clostridiaceae bacterium]|nr:sensor histidine kinase [Clostridiaceae bacterium]